MIGTLLKRLSYKGEKSCLTLSYSGFNFSFEEKLNKNIDYNGLEFNVASDVRGDVILLVAQYGKRIGYLYLGATVTTMYKLTNSVDEIYFTCIIKNKRNQDILCFRQFLLPAYYINALVETLNDLPPVSDNYIEVMNESRKPTLDTCKKILSNSTEKSCFEVKNAFVRMIST